MNVAITGKRDAKPEECDAVKGKCDATGNILVEAHDVDMVTTFFTFQPSLMANKLGCLSLIALGHNKTL